jgi:general secretion pathway protein K
LRVSAGRAVRNGASHGTQSRFASQHGLALVIVLWIVTLLTVIATSFLYAMRTDVKVVTNGMSRAKAEAAAEAAIHRALFDLYKPATVNDRWLADGVAHEWRYGEANVNVAMVDESGKIDINVVSDQLMRGVLVAQGLSEDDAAALVDAMADWRDQDNLKRLRGAEEAEYVAAQRKYKPANAPFQTIEELKLVLGITPELYRRLEPLITTYSRQPGINSQIASRDVLRSVPGATDALVDAYIQQRELARANKAVVPPFQPALPYLAGGNGFVVGVRAVATLDDGTVYVRDAVSLRSPNPKRPVVFLRWQEGDTQGDKQSDTQGNTLSPGVGENALSAPPPRVPVAPVIPAAKINAALPTSVPVLKNFDNGHYN